MKKFICAISIMAISLSSIQITFAESTMDIEQDFLVETYMSLEEKQDVFGDVDNLENATVYLADDVEEAKRAFNIQTDEEDQEKISQGLVKVNEKIYVLEDAGERSTYATPTTKVVINENSWNKAAKVLNKSTKGMRYWLDVAFNVTIGSVTKKAWIAATVIGLNPSNFLPDWQKGDILESSESMIARDKWIQVKGTSGYINSGRARKEDITVYVDLRTSKMVNGKLQSFRDSGENNFVNITKNYNSERVLKSKTLEAVLDGRVLGFYEDPWIK